MIPPRAAATAHMPLPPGGFSRSIRPGTWRSRFHRATLPWLSLAALLALPPAARGSTPRSERVPAPGAVLLVATADFDEDGRIDVAGLDINDGVVLFHNDGLGRLREEARIASGELPIAMTLGDLDGDGHVDIASADIGTASLDVLFGRGDGTFEPPIVIPTVFARFLATGDFDADGMDDVISSGGSDGRLRIFYGSRGRTFEDSPVIATPVEYIHHLTATDLDGDGHQDLVVWGRESPYLIIYEGNGARQFTLRNVRPPESGFAPGSDPLAAAAADFDGDGQMELLTCHNIMALHAATLSRFHLVEKALDSEDYVASPWGDDLEGLLSSGLTPTDADGDGFLDILIVGGVREGGGSAAIIPNALRRSLPPCRFPLSSAPELLLVSSRGEDFDGDGVMDFVVALHREDVLEVVIAAFDYCRLQGGCLYDAAPAVEAGVEGSLLVQGGDFAAARAGDELLVLGSGRGRLLAFGPGGVMELSSFGAPLVSHGLAAGDVDADGTSDFALSDFANGTVELRRVRDGTPLAPEYGALSPESLPAGLALADLDRDGAPDVVVALASEGCVAFLRGLEEGRLAPPQFFAVGARPFALAAGDVDGDGAIEVVVSGYDTPGLTLLPGRDAPGLLGAPVPIVEPDVATAVVLDDLDENGLDDIISLSNAGRWVTARMSFAGGPRTVPVGVQGVGAPAAIAVADTDGDGRRELLVARALTRTVDMYAPEGDGFVARDQLRLPPAEDSATPIALAAGRLAGGDALLDILVGDRGSGELLLFQALGCGELTPPRTFRRGDTNTSGALELTDAVRLLNYLFLGGEAPACPDAADTNDDGELNLTDGIATLSFLFLGGATPAAPGPAACGPDDRQDDLPLCESECR